MILPMLQGLIGMNAPGGGAAPDIVAATINSQASDNNLGWSADLPGGAGGSLLILMHGAGTATATYPDGFSAIGGGATANGATLAGAIKEADGTESSVITGGWSQYTSRLQIIVLRLSATGLTITPGTPTTQTSNVDSPVVMSAPSIDAAGPALNLLVYAIVKQTDIASAVAYDDGDAIGQAGPNSAVALAMASRPIATAGATGAAVATAALTPDYYGARWRALQYLVTA